MRSMENQLRHLSMRRKRKNENCFGKTYFGTRNMRNPVKNKGKFTSAKLPLNYSLQFLPVTYIKLCVKMRRKKHTFFCISLIDMREYLKLQTYLKHLKERSKQKQVEKRAMCTVRMSFVQHSEQRRGVLASLVFFQEMLCIFSTYTCLYSNMCYN